MKPAFCLLAFSVAAAAASPAHAGGYFSGWKGARAAGRAGAFAVKADDLSAAALNPAGLARIESNTIQVSNRFSYNSHSFTRQPTLDWGDLDNGVPPYVVFDEVQNDKPWQLLDPLIGVSTKFGLRDWVFALVSYSPAGVARQEFPVDGAQRYMMVSRDAQIINHTANAAFRVSDEFAVGASLQWIIVPKLDYSLIIDGDPFDQNPVSSPLDMVASLSGSDTFTPNAILGAWYRPAPFLELGVSGQIIPADIRTQSTLSVEPLGSGFSTDVVLQRDFQPANDVQLSLPLPLTARLGVRYIQHRAARELFDIELNLVYETLSRVERFTMDGSGLRARFEGQDVDIGLIEVEKHWRDTFAVLLGGDYAAVPNLLSLRGGLFYETGVAPRAYSNVDFVNGQQLGGTLGGSLLLDQFEVALSYEYRHQPTVHLTEGEGQVYVEAVASNCQPPYDDAPCNEPYFGQPAPTVNAGTYRAHSHIASLDVLYRF